MSDKDLNAPTWQMNDAYGDIGSPRWNDSLERFHAHVEALASIPVEEASLARAWRHVDEATTILSSLQCFVKCTGAKDQTDTRIAPTMAALAAENARLAAASRPFLDAILALPAESPVLREAPVSDWAFEFKEKRTHWERALAPADAAWWSELKVRIISTLNYNYKALQKQATFKALDSDGNEVNVGPARLMTILKGDPDMVLRRNAVEGIRRGYGGLASLFADNLNTLNGLRHIAFKKAGTTQLDASLAQNRMSRAALDAMKAAIEANIDVIRESNTLRAPFFGSGKLAFEDLLAEPPAGGEGAPAAPKIPYDEGIAIAKKSLGKVNPEMADFIDLLLEKGWVEAEMDDKKVGGAFYSRFNEFKIPRVFSTYVGTIHSVQQQAHEMGHAFHYWKIRDLPVVQTEFPMTLTETASTFNEAVVRHDLLQEAAPEKRFEMLWQEVKSMSNMLLNIMARHEFELLFLERLEKGYVNAETCCELMNEAWRKWYGDSATEDTYLWAHKLHFYKADQLVYNYPYTVGYLMSQALMREYLERGEAFYPFYIELLRDTGRMSVDDLIRKHFKADPTDTAFWQKAIDQALCVMPEFRELARKAAREINKK